LIERLRVTLGSPSKQITQIQQYLSEKRICMLFCTATYPLLLQWHFSRKIARFNSKIGNLHMETRSFEREQTIHPLKV
jgi:hypothetical protein